MKLCDTCKYGVRDYVCANFAEFECKKNVDTPISYVKFRVTIRYPEDGFPHAEIEFDDCGWDDHIFSHCNAWKSALV